MKQYGVYYVTDDHGYYQAQWYLYPDKGCALRFARYLWEHLTEKERKTREIDVFYGEPRGPFYDELDMDTCEVVEMFKV